ncbi:V-type ATP synthase subunit D [Thermogladius sp. 4427co]|uniref:V-type ATP synthase subunit D n=1 Tax=Thermogladius sp. 4427co TaxID=3450718 RepID=UPI003F798F9D
MSLQIIKISRPTKIELIRLRKRLALARRYYNILKDRETFLLQSFRDTYMRLVEDRRLLNKLLGEALNSYYTALSIHGWQSIIEQAGVVREEAVFKATYKNILGVWVYGFEPGARISPQPQLLPELAGLQRVRNDILTLIARIAENERALINIGMEISRLRRIVNTLEKVYIPRLEKTIRYLSMKFDEMQREDTVRTLRVKRMLEAR